jgi:chromosome segregation ATPase
MAFYHYLRDTIVCDNIDQATALAFNSVNNIIYFSLIM